MTLSIVIVTIAVILIIEGLIIGLFPLWFKKMASKMVKNIKFLKKIAFWELIIGILLLLIGISLRQS